MSEIRNAKITDTSISMGDHGCLTFRITLEGDAFGVSYGGYCIGHGFLGSDTFTAENGSGLVAMMRIMDVVGVEKIGNIIEDKWFDIDEFFKEYRKEE